MNRLYIIHLEILQTRYTAQWRRWLFNGFVKEDIEVINIDGPVLESRTDNKSFLNWSDTILFKSDQIRQIAELFKEGKINKGDKFLFSDGWNPEVISLKYLSVMNNIPIKIFGLFHAGSWDPNDLVYQNNGREFFKGFEESLFNCLDKSIVATKFHKQLILKTLNVNNPDNIIVTGFPYSFEELDNYKNMKKENLILFPHRLSEEKQPNILKNLEKNLNNRGYEVIFCQENKLTKHEYHTLLGKSKMIFSANLQETWGISSFEGMYLNSIPYLPNRLSYKEMYENNFLYPSDWTINYKSFLENRNLILGDILDKLKNYNHYPCSIERNMEFLKEKYCTIKNIIKEIKNA